LQAAVLAAVAVEPVYDAGFVPGADVLDVGGVAAAEEALGDKRRQG